MHNSRITKLVAKLIMLNLLVLLFFSIPADTNRAPIVKTFNKSDVLSVEEPLIQSALHCIYPDESFQQTKSLDFAKYALVTAETDAARGYWAVTHNIDYRVIFVNLDRYNDDSIDIYDWQSRKKEDLVANDSLQKYCASIWLVAPNGDYDAVWFDENLNPGIVRKKGGFSIHLNFRQEA